MKILVVSQIYAPTPFRINDMTRHWVKSGHEVTVLTGLPDYGLDHIPTDYRWGKRRFEVIDGVHVYRVKTTARRTGVFWRALNYASFAINGSIWARFKRLGSFDLVFAYETSPIFQVKPAIVLKRRLKCPLILYCLDLWPESLKAWNVQEKNHVFKWTRAISARIYRQADQLPVTSEGFKDYLVQLGVEKSRITYIPQYADSYIGDTSSGEYVDSSNTSKIVASNDLNDHRYTHFLYAGNLGSVQDLKPFMHALATYPERHHIKIDIVGTGSEQDELKSLVQSLLLQDQVVFHGRKKTDEMAPFFDQADVFVLPLKADGAMGFTLPAKLQSYMAAGRPILAGVSETCQKFIKTIGCGIACDHQDVSAWRAGIQMLSEDVSIRQQMGEKGYQYYLNHFTKETVMAQFEDLFDVTMNGHELL